ncbi:DUF5615 family PIN-like protein [Algoriphagus confluentis]|uniref:DUF5615 family PIN-like protein n=1 Tax=Algoriphagus confluentis TaxID=1697556 RepID=A0ABQ6PSS9_9BACT|nr:DUF5615 family PIN-like protein [Algoriphagus confluentis]
MRLLFDQDISPKILKKGIWFDFEVQHVRFVGLEDSSDLEIFQFARLKNFSIVTFDSDFFDLSILKGFPPKIIWIRTGNLTTKSIFEIFLNHKNHIIEFLENEDSGVLEIINP